MEDHLDWQEVPHPTRGTTIAAMVRKGIIEHRNKTQSFGEWLAWGEIRFIQTNAQVNPAPDEKL